MYNNILYEYIRVFNKILRTEYMDSVKRNLRSQLNNIDIEEKDGSVINLGEKYGNKKGH